MFIVQVFQETEHFKSFELYLGGVLKMEGHSVVTLWGETKWLLLWLSGTGLV